MLGVLVTGPAMASRHPALPSRMPSLRRQKIALWLVCLAMGLISLSAIYTTQRLIAASDRGERSQLFILGTHQFLSDIKDIEAGSRGYYLTGDARFLRTRSDAIGRTREAAQRLRQLAGNSQARDDITALIAAAEERIARSQQLVAQRDRTSAAPKRIALGSEAMDELDRRARAVVSHEAEAHRLERQARERQALMAGIALAGGLLLFLLAISWLFSLRGREVERRRRLESELRALNVELEDRVRERTADVRRASTLLNAVVENLPDMVLLKEPSGAAFHHLLVNPAGEQLMGIARNQFVGSTEYDLFPKDEAAEIIEASWSVARAGVPRSFTDRKLTTANGIRTVETRMVPIIDGNGETGLILAIVRDVSEAREQEIQLRQLQRMDAIGRLTGGVAHDFNNLLAIIRGNIELVRGRLAEDSAMTEMLDDVVDAATRGTDLVRRLLAFARMQHLEPTSVDLGERLPNVTGLLQRVLGEHVQLRVSMADGLWPAAADPSQVDDALLNLAINARDAMTDGGTLTIEVQNIQLDPDYSAQQVEVTPGDYVMLAVSDTGSGMAPDVVARAFEPFFTTKEEGKGTGLGLSQVFGWIKQSGGHIKIYSEVGHGTTVKLYLPRAEQDIAQSKRTGEADAAAGNETILVAEDNEPVRKTVVRQLRDLGYASIETDSAQAAMEGPSDGDGACRKDGGERSKA